MEEDRSVAAWLASEPTSFVSVWWDYQVVSGEDFHDAILGALEVSRVAIVIWSTTLLGRHGCGMKLAGQRARTS